MCILNYKTSQVGKKKIKKQFNEKFTNELYYFRSSEEISRDANSLTSNIFCRNLMYTKQLCLVFVSVIVQVKTFQFL